MTGAGLASSRAAAASAEDAEAARPLGSRLELTAGTDGLVVLSSASRQISLFTEARYRLTARLQAGSSVAFRYQNADEVSQLAFQWLAGPVFNWSADSDPSLGGAFFVAPQVGLTTGQLKFGQALVDSNTQATGAIQAGKRFRLSSSVSYSPSVSVVKEWSFDPSFVLQPIALSVFF